MGFRASSFRYAARRIRPAGIGMAGGCNTPVRAMVRMRQPLLISVLVGLCAAPCSGVAVVSVDAAAGCGAPLGA